MRKIKDCFSNMKIKYKLIVAIYMVIIPALITTTGYLYMKEYRDTVQSMTELYENLSLQSDQNINHLQDDLIDLSTYLCVNSDVRYILNAKKENLGSKLPLLWEKSAPMGFIEDMVSIKNGIKTMILYTENGIRPFYLSRDTSVHNTIIEEVHDTVIYKKALEAKGDYVWTREDREDTELFIKNKSDKIIVSRVIFDWSKKKRLGYLAIGVNTDIYVSICKKALKKENEGIAVCNRSGEELARAGLIDESILKYIQSTDFLQLNPEQKQNYFEYNDYFVFCHQTEENGNFICYMVPKQNWLSKIQNVKIMPTAFLIILFIGLGPLSIFASTIVSKPLQKLYRSMMKFRSGDFEQQIEVVGHDEIGQVTDCFNQMVKDIKDLIERNYIMVIKDRESELDALQAQINPHFLYNAMDSLYWQALNAGSDKLAEDIFSLSQLFRLVLNKGRGIIPVSQEKELIFHYLQIQKMRFEKKLNYTIEMEEEILSYRIPKLILQPFVENAIVHGLECIDRMGMIEIKGNLEGDNIVFQVIDNGAGMSREQLDQLFEEQETKEYSSQRIGRYAIKNVRERLDLKYHGEFKLEIQSEVGKGTTISIVIPAGKE